MSADFRSAHLPSLQPILADAHVHIYDCFNLDQFLDTAHENFTQVAERFGYREPFVGVLFLTETSRDHYFEALFNTADSSIARPSLTQRWQVCRTAEADSLYLCTEGKGLYLIAGRQIVTAEDLEVLALGSPRRFEDGQPIEAVLQDVIAHGELPVIPWGFGKWLGRRGTILSDLLARSRFSPLFLGDNSGRPQFWQQSPYFQQAEQLGLQVLPGTDPLPFAAEAARPGRFGFTLQGSFDPERPTESVKRLLTTASASDLKAYGALETPFRFVRNQVAMQIEKRKRKIA